MTYLSSTARSLFTFSIWDREAPDSHVSKSLYSNLFSSLIANTQTKRCWKQKILLKLLSKKIWDVRIYVSVVDWPILLRIAKNPTRICSTKRQKKAVELSPTKLYKLMEAKQQAVRIFLLQLFREGFRPDGQIARSKKVSATQAHSLLQIHAAR